MADVSSADTKAYGEYLISQGQKPEDVKAYVSYLNDHHDVPEEKPGILESGKRIAKKTIDIGLPIAGAAVGSVLAAPLNIVAPGVAEVAGAGLGWAGGKQLARIADKNVFGEDGGASGVAGIADQTARDISEGALYEAGGQALGAGIKGAGEWLRGTRAGAAGSKQAVNAVQSQGATAAADSAASSKAMVSGGDLSVTQEGRLFNYKAPQNLKELEQWKPGAESGEVLGRARLKEIESIVPDLQAKPLKFHYDMMENPKAMKELKVQFENLPTESAKKIATYNQEIINESARKIEKTVQDITGAEPKSISDSGHDLISTVKNKYESEKEALAPMFDSLQKSPGISAAESRDLAVSIGQNSRLGKLMEANPETGRLFLNKNTPRTGLSDSEHSILSRVIDDLNDGMTFKEMQDTRDFLRKAIDPANPKAMAEVSKVRSIMLGQMEQMAAKRGANVGETFKAYALNERARESVEKVIGGSIDSLDKMYAANPEKVVQKIFSNPNYTNAVGNYVGEEKMQEMVQSYLKNGIDKSFDSATGFNPRTLKTWLKANNNFLSANVDPEVAQRLKALADYGYYGKRFLDEVNPSGTAASLKAMIEPGTFLQTVKQKGFVTAVQSQAAGMVESSLKQRQAVNAVNESLGAAPKPGVAEMLGEKVSAAKPAFVSAASRTAAQAAAKGIVKNVPQVKVAGDDTPSKGPDKWANDGFKNLIEHATTAERKKMLIDIEQKLKRDPRGKSILSQASDLKPGSKAMENLLKQIQDKYGEDGN